MAPKPVSGRYSSVPSNARSECGSTASIVIASVVLGLVAIVSLFFGCRYPRTAEGFFSGGADQGATSKGELRYYKMATCPHCKDFDKDWPAVKEYASSLKVSAVEIDSSSPEVGKNGISGYPTLQLIKADGSKATFDDHRSPETIKAWLDKQIAR